MIRSVRMALALLEAADRRRLLGLVPVILLASLSDIVIVVLLNTVLNAINNPDQPLPLQGWLLAQGVAATPSLVVTVLIGLCTVALTNAATVLNSFQLARFGWDQTVLLSERMLAAILRREYQWFLQQSSPALKQQVLVETQRVIQVLIMATMQIVGRLFGAFGIIVFLLVEDPGLTILVAVTTSAFYAVLYRLMRNGVVKWGRERSLSDRRRHQITEESLIGVKELKLHGLERTAIERFQVPNEVYATSLTYVNTLQSLGKPALEIVGLSGLALVIIAFHLMDRPLSGVMVLLGTYGAAALRLLPTLQLGFRTMVRIQTESHALTSVTDHLREPPPELDLSTTPEIALQDTLTARAVDFRYPGTDRDVLRGIDLEIHRGSWVAFVGSTGSGKTTLVDLLMGLLPPSKGEIAVDGVPLDSPERVKRWQAEIGYVPQSLFMSDTTMASNIAFGYAEVDRERVRASARMACVDDVIEQLPDGYDTAIGERGMRVSGGQRQRIGIARALYRRPAFLVLDEATSALDNRTEARVMDALRENFADTTVLMIAHRLSTTRHCDSIVLLEQGRILDQGSYDELLERNAYFRQLVEASKDPA